MDTRERLRQSIDLQHDRLRRDIPPDRDAALLALVHAQAQLPRSSASAPPTDLVTGHRITNLGANKAMWLCLDASGNQRSALPDQSSDALAGWAERFLRACGELAEAELVLAHVETGFMKLVESDTGLFSAWIATRRAPATWRERADIDWWASSLAGTHEPELDDTRNRLSNRPGDAETSTRLGEVYLKMMAYQLGYGPEVIIGGLRVGTWLDILAGLIAWGVQAHERASPGRPLPEAEHALVTRLAATLAMPPDIVRHAIAGFALDPDNAAWHAAVPGVAAAPLVRLGGDRLVPSVYGLTTEPLFFLTRELRRRDPQAYHNAAQAREEAFRQDLYAIFEDRRFVKSAGTIRLRQGKGDLRTDIDAVVFDRKTGTLGVFELKSHDPFARSSAALARQRDNVLYASRQISGVLDWTQRYGANELLSRVDAPTAKRFRAYKVYPFVLGRYLAQFHDGAQPDHRAAWGTWPQLLRLLKEQPLQPTDAAPIASLFARLQGDDSRIRLPEDGPSREIGLGGVRLVVHPSFASFQAHGASSPYGRSS